MRSESEKEIFYENEKANAQNRPQEGRQTENRPKEKRGRNTKRQKKVMNQGQEKLRISLSWVFRIELGIQVQ